MPKFTELPAHPLADLFPMGTEAELKTMADSIRDHGLSEAIWTHEGQVLDGRRRQRACSMAGVLPTYRPWKGENGSPTVFVIVKNLIRRHLSTAEKAKVAIEAKGWLEKEAEERQKASRAKPGEKIGQHTKNAEEYKDVQAVAPPKKDGDSMEGKARTQAGKLVGVSGETVRQAEKVEEKGTPELKKAMAENVIPVSRAAKLADKTPEQQLEAIKKAESQPKSYGVDEDQRKEQLPRSLRKFLNQHMDLNGMEESSREKAHDLLDEMWPVLVEERKRKRKE